MNFHDVVSELRRNAVGCRVEATISRTGVEDSDGYAPIARLEGTATAVEESILPGRGVQLRIELDPEHESARGMVEFARDDFVSAEISEEDDPWGLQVRQTSAVISLSVYRRSASPVPPDVAAESDETDLPF